MARFTAYDKKTKPDDTDTLLIYDDDASPDTLKQIDIKALFESYDSTSYNGTSATLKAIITQLIQDVADASVAKFS